MDLTLMKAQRLNAKNRRGTCWVTSPQNEKQRKGVSEGGKRKIGFEWCPGPGMAAGSVAGNP